MDISERKKRESELVSETAKKKHIISKFLIKAEMNIKGANSNSTAIIKELSADSSKIHVWISENRDLKEGEKIILFKVLARYISLQCTVLAQKPQSHYIMQIDSITIAKKDREDKRIQPPANTVWVTNIRTSKTNIDASLYNIPTFVKVNFADYETKLKASCDIVKVDVFSGVDEKLNLVRRSGKTIFIENTSDKDSYKALNDDFIDYAEELDDEISQVINDYKAKKIVSEMIVPVIYVNHDQVAIPIGYIQMQSKSTPFDLGKVMEIKTLTFEMVDRIRESNTSINTEKFPVTDLSSGGLKVKIDNKELINELPKHAGFTFDIFFKMQSPLTTFGLIRSVSKDIDGNIYLGIALMGNSARQGEKKRFLDNLNALKNTIRKPGS
ncbi:MAG: DUF1577 domain-containing protein [Leptospiraceae bacterium]|nr:DUF1577 domain-containing protein [Leptospiraceae bacterium]MCK6381256.1 DUF1577 domain-containing protein [Leptospiraceae bacterium]NUM42981.1 DUF1577 domain-containing protein [Leptospiraceae bacterium]